jgi:pyruvate-formate lyase-activating enzyme
MATITFDTLKFANKLKSAGVLPEHAEAEAEALADIFEVNLKEVATKEDFKLLKEDIKHLEERIDSKFIQLEQRMTIKLGTLMVIAVSAVAALVKLL